MDKTSFVFEKEFVLIFLLHEGKQFDLMKKVCF
jgi:hypothetical protein